MLKHHLQLRTETTFSLPGTGWLLVMKVSLFRPQLFALSFLANKIRREVLSLEEYLVDTQG